MKFKFLCVVNWLLSFCLMHSIDVVFSVEQAALVVLMTLIGLWSFHKTDWCELAEDMESFENEKCQRQSGNFDIGDKAQAL